MARAFAGDEVFFHHKGQPKSGKVKCSGRHGCLVADCEGQQHKLKWQHISGFKSRAPQDFKVLDHGHDGLIAENKTGERRFFPSQIK